MAEANVEVVRRLFEAYAKGGLAAAAEFTHPDFEVRFTARHPLGRALRGAREATEAMTEFEASFEDFRGDAEEFIDAGDHRVVVAIRQRGRPRGATVELAERWGILYSLRDGKIVRMEWFDSFEEALAAAGADNF